MLQSVLAPAGCELTGPLDSTPSHPPLQTHTRPPTHPRERPDVILVPMCDDHRLNPLSPLREEASVRQDLLHSQVGEAVRGGGGGGGGGGMPVSGCMECACAQQVGGRTPGFDGARKGGGWEVQECLCMRVDGR
jgi:hypothetical protein